MRWLKIFSSRRCSFEKAIASARGAFLLEALLVVVILSVSMTLVVQSFVTSYRALKVGLNELVAVAFAENVIFAIMERKYFSAGWKEEKTAEPPYDNHRHQLQVKPTDNKNLNEMELVISWKSGRQERALKAKTLVLSPAAKETESDPESEMTPDGLPPPPAIVPKFPKFK